MHVQYTGLTDGQSGWKPDITYNKNYKTSILRQEKQQHDFKYSQVIKYQHT